MAEKKRRSVSMLEWGTPTLPVYKCPSCGQEAQFKHVGGSYPGMECGHCRQFHADFNWEVKDGTLKKRYTHKPRKSYVDAEAISSMNKLPKNPSFPVLHNGYSEDKLAIEEAIEEMAL